MKSSVMQISPGHAALFGQLGLTADAMFTDPRIKVWRKLNDRENAVLDETDADGLPVRLHIKRYPFRAAAMAQAELRGYELLKNAGIPAAPIIAAGSNTDGASFIVLQDLAGYTPADKLLEKNFPFDRLLNATADLAAMLHERRLHHRDLYLCHFMVRYSAGTVDAKLIDMARVSRMNNPLTRRRWTVKDLGQFWFSSLNLPITDAQRNEWFERYCNARGLKADAWLRAVMQKSDTIARHDKRLRKLQPGRNVSIEDLN